MVQMPFMVISIFSSGSILFDGVSVILLVQFGSGHWEKHYCEIILVLASGLGNAVKSLKDISFFFSSGGHFVLVCIFGRNFVK